MNGGRQAGEVRWFNDTKGYGFITPRGGQEDLFVHHSEILGQRGRRTLQQGDAVTFETTSTPKGLRAVQVRRDGDGND